MTTDEAAALVGKRMGMAFAIVIFTRNLRINFVQAAMSLDMWRQGCSEKMFLTLKHLGISQSKKSAWVHADRLCVEHDKAIKRWKEEIQVRRVCIGTRKCCHECVLI